MGSGGAPEGVLAAAALRCVGGQIQGKLLFRNDDEVAPRPPLGDRRPRPHLRDSRTWPRATASSPRPASPTARCSQGVHRRKGCFTTESIVMRASSGTVRRVATEHYKLGSQRSL